MPIIRKIFRISTSRAITLPKSWMDYLERECGREIREVAIEVNRKLVIEAITDGKTVFNRKKKDGGGRERKRLVS